MRNGNPKTQVLTPNLGHPPPLYTFPRRDPVISSPRLLCQSISSFQPGPPVRRRPSMLCWEDEWMVLRIKLVTSQHSASTANIAYRFYLVSSPALFLGLEFIASLIIIKRQSFHVGGTFESVVWLLPIFMAIPLVETIQSNARFRSLRSSNDLTPKALIEARQRILAHAFHSNIAIFGALTVLLLALFSR
jgi:hypothetical protein